MYAVTGATGNTGSVVANTLLRQGNEVTVVLRDDGKAEEWKAKGAQVAIADLADAAALTTILRGAEGAYIMLPPQYGADDFFAAMSTLADALAKAVKDSGIPHIVMLSSVGAQHAQGTGPIRNLHYAESVIPPAAKNSTVLHASYFLQNWASVLGAAQNQGVLPSFFPAEASFAQNATEDIGRIAAGLLQHPATGHKLVEMSGPRDYSPNDIAAALTSILGKPVKVLALPLSAAVPTLTQAGFTPDVARLFAEMYEGAMKGLLGPSDVEQLRGTVTARESLAAMLAA